MLFKQKELPFAIDAAWSIESEYSDVEESYKSIALLSDDLDRLKSIRTNNEFIPRDQVEWMVAVNHAALGEVLHAISTESHSHYLDDAIVSLEGLITGAISAVWRFIIKMIDKAIDVLVAIKNWFSGTETKREEAKKSLIDNVGTYVPEGLISYQKVLVHPPKNIADSSLKLVGAIEYVKTMSGITEFTGKLTKPPELSGFNWDDPILGMTIDTTGKRSALYTDAHSNQILTILNATDTKVKSLNKTKGDLEKLKKNALRQSKNKSQTGIDPNEAKKLVGYLNQTINSMRSGFTYRIKILGKVNLFNEALKKNVTVKAI